MVSLYANQVTRIPLDMSNWGGVAVNLATAFKKSTSYKVHWSVLDYCQRSARHLSSAVDTEIAVSIGREGINALLNNHTDEMLTVEKISTNPFQWTIGKTELEHVANYEKKLPEDFYDKENFCLTEKAHQEIRPLINGEEYPLYYDGLPYKPQFRLKQITKKLVDFIA